MRGAWEKERENKKKAMAEGKKRSTDELAATGLRERAICRAVYVRCGPILVST
jgi:hypothetical protein